MPATRAAMSFAGAVGFAEETTPGTAVSPTAWIAADSATPTVRRSHTPFSVIANDWETLSSVRGLLEASVSLSFQVYASEAISDLLEAGIYRVPFDATEGQINQPKSYTIELVMDNGKSIRLVGCRANSLSMQVRPGETVKATMEFQAIDASAITSNAPSVSIGAMFHGATASVEFGGTPNVLCNSFDLSIANNASRRNTFTGTGKSRAIRAGNQMVTGNLQFDFDDTTQFDAFLDGTDQAIEMTLTASDSSTLVIDLPVVRYQGDDPALNGANIVEDKISWMAVKGESYACAVTLTVD